MSLPKNPPSVDPRPPPANVDLNAGLVAYYAFEDGVGGRLADAGGQGFDGEALVAADSPAARMAGERAARWALWLNGAASPQADAVVGFARIPNWISGEIHYSQMRAGKQQIAEL
ncbi:MAG: hypothetical protein O3A00_19755 [Planctomycetota bacterium]|nr:hypothetical protein [Planctomycetota bacterium]